MLYIHYSYKMYIPRLQNYCFRLNLKNFRRLKKMNRWSNKFWSRRNRQNKNMNRMNSRFRWNRVYSRTYRDNNKSLFHSRFGSSRRNLRDWKSTCRMDSSCYRCNNRYIRSRLYRLNRKTNKLRTYNSDIRLAYSRFRKKNHKHNVRSSF